MLRLIHNQTVLGALLIDDIDDGLPNKTAKRLGGTADPKAYQRDGYANVPKQPCYVPVNDATDSTLAGFIDLKETDRVIFSNGKGKIKKFSDGGFLTIVSLVASDLDAPVVTTGVIDDPTAGDITLTGTGFLSVLPHTSSVIITGDGAVTLTEDEITTGGGTISDTSIVIPAALVPGISDTTSSVAVLADAQTSDAVVVS